MRLPLENVIWQYQDRLYKISFSVCKNTADAEDVVQDTFVKYHQSKKQFESEEHMRAWLIRVCINLSKNVVTSLWNRNRIPWDEHIEGFYFEEESDRRLFDAVMSLPLKYRIAIHLFYYEDYSVREIAQVIRKQEGTVKSHLSRGRKLLKQQLKEEWSDDE